MKHEIELYHAGSGCWAVVTDWIFRSWGGRRRLNGDIYHGPVYYLGSPDIAIPFQDPAAGPRDPKRKDP